MKKLYTVIICVLAFAGAWAQELKLDDAISKALTNNHSIIIAQYSNEAVQTDVHIGNAGLLPKVDATAGGSYNLSTSNLEFANNAFPAIEGQEAAQSNSQAKVAVSYMIFNGGARYRTFAKLKSSGELSELQTKVTIESSLIQVVNSYYEVVRLQNQVELLEKSLSISKDRLNRVQTNYSYGNMGKIDWLNAKVDFNSDSSNLVNAELDLRKAKNQLNYLMGVPISNNFSVPSEVQLPTLKRGEEYVSLAKSNNTSVLLSNIQINIAELDKKINTSVLMPSISASFDYGYQGSQNDVGVVQKSTALGYTGGISLSWNLFDGLKQQKAIEKAKINLEKGNVQLQQTLLNIEKEVQNYYDAITVNIKLLALEKSNLTVAQLNLKRSKELLLNGSITNLEFRQAQLNLFRVENKINNYKYVIKILEYQLLRMTNQLVQ